MQLEEIKPSSRRYPYIKFDPEVKLHRLALQVEGLSNGYDNAPNLFNNVDLMLEAGKKLAVIGPNGIGKTTFLKTILNKIEHREGSVKWAEKAKIGYFAQDHQEDFEKDMTLLDWIDQWSLPTDDEQVVRGTLGRMLFSGDSISKSVKVLSGGEKVRMLIGKLILQRYNVLILDEPTNHLDMESIEALNIALEEFPGTIIIVSHDRQLISSLADEIIEIKHGQKTEYFQGKYEEYLTKQADTI